MSRCISRAGEYGDHVLADTGTAVERFVCSRCFVVAEDELFAEVDSLRAELAAAEQERDNLDRLAADRYHEARQLRAALAAVRELHQPDMSWLKAEAQGDPDYRDRSACKGCLAPNIGGFSYGQCPTRRILAAAEQDEPKREQS